MNNPPEKSAQPPRFLYRYVDRATAWKCLSEATLAFTPPQRFNDPFDTNPALKTTGLSDQTASAMHNTRDAFANNLIGVACFTANKDDPLMWAHYGDKHRGVMLEFDTANADLAKAEPVTYSAARPVVDGTGRGAGKALLVKGDVWATEHEWRLTAKLSQCRVRMVGGAPIYLQTLERRCFASITFGCRAETSLVVALANALRGWGLEHCLLRRLYLCDKTYSFTVRENKVENIWQLN